MSHIGGSYLLRFEEDLWWISHVMITHIGGSECYNHIMLHTHQTQVPPQSCWNGGLPDFFLQCCHSDTIFSDNALWILQGGKLCCHSFLRRWWWWKYYWLTEWPLPESLFSWFLLCLIAAQLLNKNITYKLYGFHYHDHHCHDCFQHDHLLHISLHFHFHPPMSCFCLDHLLLWRLGRSWWLSLAISRIICFHCLQDFSLIMACLLSQFYQRNIHFLSNAILCSPEMGG